MDENPVKNTSIEGLLVIKRPTYSDERGFFRETARVSEIEAAGTPFLVKQTNHARSVKNVLRGIHAAPWNKMIYVTRGEVQAVIVDLRPDSSTFGKHEPFLIGDENRASIFIPKGCGNSYLVLSDEADYTYLTDEEWAPGKEVGVLWNDPDIGISWQVDEPIVAEKDKNNPTMRVAFPNKF
jgi:dTDP-4-dehydrorhamnose 3,5-epimerase